MQYNQTSLYKTKRIEQSHIGFAMPGISVKDQTVDAFSIANIILGGGMSSRLFQRIREELGLAYSVYSYASQYKDNGVLEISILEEFDGIKIQIKNQGVKLKTEEKEKIFEKFYRADNSHSIEGTGVGLTIVKKTLDLHGGKIEVENEGDFTVFSVKLFNTEKIK